MTEKYQLAMTDVLVKIRVDKRLQDIVFAQALLPEMLTVRGTRLKRRKLQVSATNSLRIWFLVELSGRILFPQDIFDRILAGLVVHYQLDKVVPRYFYILLDIHDQ